MIREFQIKQELRRLNKIKKDLRKGTDQYKEVKNKIKEIKVKLEEKNKPLTEIKKKLITEIISLTEPFFTLIMDYSKFTEEQLKHHLTKLKTKEGKNENT